jgi:hypothetical protein
LYGYTYSKTKANQQALTLDVGLVGVLGRLETLLLLEPDETELVLNIVDHGGLSLATIILISILGGGVGTLELEVVGADTLHVLAAVTFPENGDLLVGDKVESVGDNLVAGNNILSGVVSLNSRGDRM